MSKRITELKECTGLQDTDTFVIDCETNGTRKVCAEKAKQYFTEGIAEEVLKALPDYREVAH